MSEINVEVRAAVHGSGLISKEYDFTQEGDTKCESEFLPRGHNFATRHISRKELFYNQKGQQQVPFLERVGEENHLNPASPVQTSSAEGHMSSYYSLSESSAMHPEEAQISGQSEVFQTVKQLHSPDAEGTDEQIDVESCSVNGSSNGQVNSNGYNSSDHGEKMLNLSGLEDSEVHSYSSPMEGDAPIRKAAIPLRRKRQNSTSSHSSSVSSSRSTKHQIANAALQMDVSTHDDLGDNMEPLLIQGSAEDLEVSSNAVGEETEEKSADVSAFKSAELSSPELAQYLAPSSDLEEESLKETTHSNSKPSKIKKTKPTIDVEAVNEASEAPLDDLEKRPAKSSKSPSRRTKHATAKQDVKNIEEKGDEKSEPDSGLRRSSRPRHTPQKYNASPFLDYSFDNSFGDDRMNSSDVAFGINVRSVRGRKSLRKSRNMSSLNNSVHNESSPWENDFKVLTPSQRALAADEISDTIASGKRKADEVDDCDEEDGQEVKKMCVEESLDGSSSSFFSVVTSPFALLKSKFQRRSVSCSTPSKEKGNEIPAANDNEVAEKVVPLSPEGGSMSLKWCSIM